LFKPKDDREDIREKLVNQEPPKAVVTASTQIVNCLVEHVLRIEEGTTSTTGQQPQSSSSQRFIACVATLFLFAKIRPQLLVNHAITLQAYLSMKCQVCTLVQNIALLTFPSLSKAEIIYKSK
jgi:cohesin loading factor subunit SCC2